jgi:UDP-N-acetylglucosamine 2-epimerase (non-hydrolysing)
LGVGWQNEAYILITGHRRESFGEGFLEICNAIKRLAHSYKHIQFIYPVHLNPNVQKPVHSLLDNIPNIKLIDPLEYRYFIYLLRGCYLVLTDSGGIQEEAPSLGKSVLVMRDNTERPEAVVSGAAKLVGANEENIVRNVSEILDKGKFFLDSSNIVNPYGDGTACNKIIRFLKAQFFTGEN